MCPFSRSYDCWDNSRKKRPVILPAAGPFSSWNLDPPDAFHMLVPTSPSTVLLGFQARLQSAYLSLCLSAPPFFPPGCCEERQQSHMSVLFWLCCSWSRWALFFLSLRSPRTGPRTPATKHRCRCSTTAGSPCHRSTSPISSRTIRRSPSNAAWTHSVLLK